MPDTLRACVIDANVLIDLQHGGIVSALFGLPIYPMTTDFLLDELPQNLQAQLQRQGLVFSELSEADIEELALMRGQFIGPSFYDLSVLVLAKKRGAWLLTGERQLRSIAQTAGLTVHGTLWLLDEMIRHRVIVPTVAAQALQRMLQQGSRQPREECEKRLARWRALEQS